MSIEIDQTTAATKSEIHDSRRIVSRDDS